jgi:hypothetical protein
MFTQALFVTSYSGIQCERYLGALLQRLKGLKSVLLVGPFCERY